jgi:transcriptional regulator NrdR family protein
MTVCDTDYYNEHLIRRRRCLECGETYNTTEVYLEELINAQD